MMWINRGISLKALLLSKLLTIIMVYAEMRKILKAYLMFEFIYKIYKTELYILSLKFVEYIGIRRTHPIGEKRFY